MNNTHTYTGPATAGTKLPEGTAGPHTTRVANAIDPRIDSDMDGSGTGAAGHTYPSSNTTTTAGTTTGTAGQTMGTTQHTIPTQPQTTNPIKAGLAAVHGVGETIRGTINSTVDGAFNESGQKAKSNAITSAGIDEMETGRFSHGTKAREGLVPGTEGRRV